MNGLTGRFSAAGNMIAARRTGFTLVELMVSIMILALLATVVLLGLAGANEKAREDRTRAQIEKIHALISEQWESLQSRRIPMPPPHYAVSATEDFTRPYTPARRLAWYRLQAMRQLMRMEFPDRISDVIDGPTEIVQVQRNPVDRVTQNFLLDQRRVPANWKAYRRMVENMVRDSQGNLSRDPRRDWSPRNEASECLYLILSRIQDGESNGLEFFSEREIGDTDNDGILEILDAWGTPIFFVRWAPGFAETVGHDRLFATSDDGPSPSLLQTRDANRSPDAFDPMHVDPRWERLSDRHYPYGPYLLFPLVVSAGADKALGLHLGNRESSAAFQYSRTYPRNDPYYTDIDSGDYYDFDYRQGDYKNPSVIQIGQAIPNQESESVDNIHNHAL